MRPQKKRVQTARQPFAASATPAAGLFAGDANLEPFREGRMKALALAGQTLTGTGKGPAKAKPHNTASGQTWDKEELDKIPQMIQPKANSGHFRSFTFRFQNISKRPCYNHDGTGETAACAAHGRFPASILPYPRPSLPCLVLSHRQPQGQLHQLPCSKVTEKTPLLVLYLPPETS